MTMMNGLDVYDVELLDEEFFGPPPRFLRERPSASVASARHGAHGWYAPALASLATLLASVTKLIRV